MSNVIQDFLVSLGFEVNEESAKKAEERIASFSKTATVMATATYAAVSVATNNLEKLFYASRRIGASATNIQGYTAAISQMGGTAAGALQSLENIAQKIRQSPGYENLIKGLGVATRDQNGAVRDRVDMMKDLAGRLAAMPYYRANAYANALGIDENTLMAMRSGEFVQNLQKYAEIQRKLGLNDNTTKQAKEFAQANREFWMVVKGLGQVLLVNIGNHLLPILQAVTHGLEYIAPALQKIMPFVGHVIAFLMVLIAVAGQVWAAFKVFKGIRAIATLFTVFGGTARAALMGLLSPIKWVMLALRGVMMTLLTNPVGLIIAAVAAVAYGIYKLYQDYQKWKNGESSLIDWGKWLPGIQKALNAFEYLKDKLKEVWEWLTKIGMSKMLETLSHIPGLGWLSPSGNTENGTATADGAPANTTQTAAATGGFWSTLMGGIGHALGSVAGSIGGVLGHTSGSDSNTSAPVNYATLPSASGARGFNAEKGESIKRVAQNIGANPNDLAAVISFETGGSFSPSAKNPRSSGTGLIQFMKDKYQKYGFTREQFASLSFDQQMKYVEQYFKERGFRADKKTDVANLYTAVTGYGYRRGTKAYELNKVWDSNHDGYIDKGEMVRNSAFRAHQRNYFPDGGNPNRDQTHGRAATNQVSVNQNSTINIHTTADPNATAHAAGQAVNGENARLARNVRTVVR